MIAELEATTSYVLFTRALEDIIAKYEKEKSELQLLPYEE
jgi:hypothetical protein